MSDKPVCARRSVRAAGLLVLGAAAALLAGCADEAAVDTEAVARRIAPKVVNGLGVGHYLVAGGAPAIEFPLQGPPSRYGAGVVQVLEGRSLPGSRERQCTELGVRLVPFRTRSNLNSDIGGRVVLPLVADAVEREYGVTCGIP